MRKLHRAQTLMKASVTADCRPMCSHVRKAASDSTGCDVNAPLLYGGNRAAFKSLCKPQTSRQSRNGRESDVPVQIIKSFPGTHTRALPLTSPLL